MTAIKENKTVEQLEQEFFYENHKPPTELIFDDGETMESNRHRIAMNILIESINYHFRKRKDFFAGGNMFVYFSEKQVKNNDFRGPDFFAVLDVEYKPDRKGWVVWEENGRYPDVIIELMFPSTAKVDKTTKKDIYERTFHTSDYFIFEPFNPNSLKGWHLHNDHGYQELLTNEKGWLWCQKLSLWLGRWEGEVNNVHTQWLRFYDPDHNLVLLPSESALKQAEIEKQRAETAEQKALRLAARLRELGENPDQI